MTTVSAMIEIMRMGYRLTITPNGDGYHIVAAMIRDGRHAGGLSADSKGGDALELRDAMRALRESCEMLHRYRDVRDGER